MRSFTNLLLLSATTAMQLEYHAGNQTDMQNDNNNYGMHNDFGMHNDQNQDGTEVVPEECPPDMDGCGFDYDCWVNGDCTGDSEEVIIEPMPDCVPDFAFMMCEDNGYWINEWDEERDCQDLADADVCSWSDEDSCDSQCFIDRLIDCEDEDCVYDLAIEWAEEKNIDLDDMTMDDHDIHMLSDCDDDSSEKPRDNDELAAEINEMTCLKMGMVAVTDGIYADYEELRQYGQMELGFDISDDNVALWAMRHNDCKNEWHTELPPAMDIIDP